MILPSVPGLQFLAFVSILLWPVFLAVVIALYRNADMKKQQNLGDLLRIIQPKISTLMALGAACLLYGILTSLLLNSDLQGLADMAQTKTQITELQMMTLMQKMMPVILKMGLLLIPLMMATWFSPMLIAFNSYSMLKAIKSSIAGSLQYIAAMGVAWLVLTIGIVVLMSLVGIVAGIISSLLPGASEILIPMVVFSCLLVATALMLAFQYVSYRDVFRAA